MKKLILILAAILIINNIAAQTDYTAFVNPFIGTGTAYKCFPANTFAAATHPNGLVQLGPNTQPYESTVSNGYHYEDNFIYGFSHTQLYGDASIFMNDILIMPMSGKKESSIKTFTDISERYNAQFSHYDEYAYPGYYSVKLKPNDISVELTATPHTGIHKYKFPKNSNSQIIIDLSIYTKGKENIPSYLCGGNIKIIDAYNISGHRAIYQNGKTRRIFFWIKLDKPISECIFKDNENTYYGMVNIGHNKGMILKALLDFSETENIEIRTGISMISEANAKLNIEQETDGKNFNEIKSEAKKSWNEILSSIDITTTDELKKLFYSALYRTMLQPNISSDITGEFLSPFKQTEQKFGTDSYTNYNSFYAYKSLFPLLLITRPKLVKDIINSILTDYDKLGHLPIHMFWADEYYTGLANHSIISIKNASDASIDGINYEEAFDASYLTVTNDHPANSLFSELKKYDYYPENKQYSVSNTIESGYDDYCMKLIAQKTNNENMQNFFDKRSNNYTNLFNNNFFQPKNENGNFVENYNPFEYSNAYYNSNGWQNLFLPFYNIEKLENLIGNRYNLSIKLDEFFSIPLKINQTNGTKVGGIKGQYVHSNPTNHHIPYIYNRINRSWKTQEIISSLINDNYFDAPYGLCGEDKSGSLSSWLIFNLIGFYPFDPAAGIFEFGSPKLSKTVIKLNNGKTFTVYVNNCSDKNIYIQSVKLNGIPYHKNYITLDDIINGGVLDFYMSSKPLKKEN